MILVVTYDLHNPGRDYDKVIAEIRKADSWAHPQGSVWLIDTSESPTVWVERLQAVGDANDEYLIIRAHRSWAAVNMDDDVVTWLNSSERNW